MRNIIKQFDVASRVMQLENGNANTLQHQLFRGLGAKNENGMAFEYNFQIYELIFSSTRFSHQL